MNRLKPLLASLVILSASGMAGAVTKQSAPTGIGFSGVGIGSGQYLGLFLASPPAAPIAPPRPDSAVSPGPQVCNATVQVLGMDGMPVGDPLPVQTLQQGSTVFLKLAGAVTPPAAAVATKPEGDFPPTDQPPTDQPPTDQPLLDQPPPDPAPGSVTGTLDPQFFSVTVKFSASIGTGQPPRNNAKTPPAPPACNGVTGSLGVYDTASQNLQLLVPVLSTSIKQ